MDRLSAESAVPFLVPLSRDLGQKGTATLPSPITVISKVLY
jgi:hypothetical protein